MDTKSLALAAPETVMVCPNAHETMVIIRGLRCDVVDLKLAIERMAKERVGDGR